MQSSKHKDQPENDLNFIKLLQKMDLYYSQVKSWIKTQQLRKNLFATSSLLNQLTYLSIIVTLNFILMI